MPMPDPKCPYAFEHQRNFICRLTGNTFKDKKQVGIGLSVKFNHCQMGYRSVHHSKCEVFVVHHVMTEL